VQWTTADPCDVLAHLAHLLEAGRPAWQADAACRHHPQADFFPEHGGVTSAAEAVCASCPVRQKCLAFAMDDKSLTGIWAGTSVGGRRALRRRVA